MCAIFGSNNKGRLNELYKLNKHRGGHSYSIMGIGTNNLPIFVIQELGEFSISELDDAAYYIAHIQSPTDGVGTKVGIHPAHIGCHYLYHNGMVKFGVGEWDTLWILKKYIAANCSVSALEDIDGSFACVYINAEWGEIKLFTNQTCALFVNDDCEISSTKTESFKRILPCTIYNFIPHQKELTMEEEFDNIDRTYYQQRREV